MMDNPLPWLLAWYVLTRRQPRAILHNKNFIFLGTLRDHIDIQLPSLHKENRSLLINKVLHDMIMGRFD